MSVARLDPTEHPECARLQVRVRRSLLKATESIAAAHRRMMSRTARIRGFRLVSGDAATCVAALTKEEGHDVINRPDGPFGRDARAVREARAPVRPRQHVFYRRLRGT